jgi:exopolyphosphatase/guanosine-5'-triphosphate,3'-diphosphate pyrophosphatase
MKMYAAYCSARHITDVRPCATAAVRAAQNGDMFIHRVKRETGLDIRILSDYEEAYYGYLGVINSMAVQNGFILDLGGASLEITQVINRQMGETVSLPFGALLATERYLPSDPTNIKEIKKLKKAVQKAVESLSWFKAKDGLTLIGQGGTFRNLAYIAQKISGYVLEELHGYDLLLAHLQQINTHLAPLSVQERIHTIGVKEDRADIILAGGIVIETVMEIAGFSHVKMCQQGLREGIFYETFIPTYQPEGVIFEDVRRAAVLNVANNYHYQKAHAEQVAFLALSLFDQAPTDTMQCTFAERELLWAASILHDIGTTVDYNDHHKHSYYLIINGGLAGYTHRELVLIALLTRYHRKGMPSFLGLDTLMQAGDEIKLLQMSACLRLAEQLERSRDSSVQEIRLHHGGDLTQLEIRVRGEGVLALWNVQRHTDIYEKAFGKKLEIVIHPI